jgi:hypothetical protein
MTAYNRSATIGIELSQPDAGIQELFFEQFTEFKSILNQYLGEEWEWQLHHRDDEGKLISRIYTQINEVSIFNKNDWPALISFFKPRMIALDEFWNDVKYAFDALR